MGCACAKDREKEEEKTIIDQPTEPAPKKKQTKRSKSMHSKVNTSADAIPQMQEIIRRLKEPIETFYDLGDSVAQSSRATLHKSHFLGTRQDCYVKVIKKHIGRQLLQQKAKLSSEAERLSKLDHPNVLRTYDCMQDHKNFYLVSEVFQEEVLGQNLQCSTETFLAKAFHQWFRALSYCHLHGFVHSRLTPKSFVLVGSSEEPVAKITGFGEYDEVPTDDCSSDILFRAPEVTEGYNEKCDIWSTGAVLYYLLSGELPFPLATVSPQRRRKMTLTFSSPKWAGVSREAMSLISCMLDPNPHNRPSASQCRYHPWVRMHLRSHSIKMTAINNYFVNLRKLRARNPLQQALLKFVVTRLMQDSEKQSVVDQFLVLDRDGDGSINEEELLQGFRRISSEEEAVLTARKVTETLEHNGNSAINFTEFIISSIGEKKLLSPANVKTAFECFDRANTGKVSVQDFRSLLVAKDTADRERLWRELLLLTDCAEDGQLDFGKFAALIANASPA